MTRREFRIKVIFNLYLKDLINDNIKSINIKVKEAYEEVLKNLDEIDDVISDNLTNYTLNRLSYLDRAIIRYATYEMLYTDTPKAIIINEALEITKEYSDIDDLQRSFTNRLLDNIKHSLGD